ncbi:MAG: hypothetical protein M3362_11350 [Acidobacteriota bacterium]|nr:hypothetical protein [Acidobacteriota bacterium]
MKKLPKILALVSFALFTPLNFHASLAQSSHPRQTPKTGQQKLEESRSPKIEVRIEGLQSIKEKDVFAVFREQEIGVSKDAVKDLSELVKAKQAIDKMLSERGYLHAAVTVENGLTVNERKVIVFVINEGERASISEIQFEGNKIFSDQELLGLLKDAEGDEGSGQDRLTCTPSEKGYDAEQFDFCRRQATHKLHSRGYLKAELGEPKLEETERGLKLIVPVREGLLYLIGNVRVEGSTIFSPEQIIEMLNVKTGEIANDRELSRGLQGTLKEAYGNRGYIQYEYDVEPDFKPSPDRADEGIVDFAFTITEGKSFRIHSIEFYGNKQMANSELKGLLLVREGETYNELLFRDSIKKLNELGLFQPIDADRDVDYRTDEKGYSVNIAIKLKEKISQ